MDVMKKKDEWKKYTLRIKANNAKKLVFQDEFANVIPDWKEKSRRLTLLLDYIQCSISLTVAALYPLIANVLMAAWRIFALVLLFMDSLLHVLQTSVQKDYIGLLFWTN